MARTSLTALQAELRDREAKLRVHREAEARLRALVGRYERGTWTLIVFGKVGAGLAWLTLPENAPARWTCAAVSALLCYAVMYLGRPYLGHFHHSVVRPAYRDLRVALRRWFHPVG